MKNFKRSKLAGGIIMYFFVITFVYATEGLIHRAQQLYFETKPAAYWIEYVQTYPDPDTVAVGQRPLMYSETIRRRSARLEWNDIMQCDVNGDGFFSFTQNYQSSAYVEVPEYATSTTSWYFGTSDYISPPAGSVCYIVNEIKVCPEELERSKRRCKMQVTRSAPMLIE